MAIYFISDLHLSDEHPHLNTLFQHFIETILQSHDTLYILGDFFEFWVGENASSQTQALAKFLLSRLKERHISWYFLAGNRDFLLKGNFLKETAGQLLAEHTIIHLDNQAILLLHGDTLCSDDLLYQQWRKKVHQPWLQQLFLFLPLSVRLKMAEKMRQKSMAHNPYLTEAMMNVNRESTLQLFQETHTTVMIHGHVHKPGISQYWDNEHQRWLTRYVLADWDMQGNYLRYQNGAFDLCFFQTV